MKKIYYWKVLLLNVKKILIVYAHNTSECKLLVDAWFKKQNKEAAYDIGRPFAIKKDTLSDIVEKEYKHLCLEIIN